MTIGSACLLFGSQEVTSFDIGISFKDLEVAYSRSFEKNRQQTYTESSFNVG